MKKLILILILTLIISGILGGFEFTHQRGSTFCTSCMGLE